MTSSSSAARPPSAAAIPTSASARDAKSQSPASAEHRTASTASPRAACQRAARAASSGTSVRQLAAQLRRQQITQERVIAVLAAVVPGHQAVLADKPVEHPGAAGAAGQPVGEVAGEPPGHARPEQELPDPGRLPVQDLVAQIIGGGRIAADVARWSRNRAGSRARPAAAPPSSPRCSGAARRVPPPRPGGRAWPGTRPPRWWRRPGRSRRARPDRRQSASSPAADRARIARTG